MDRDLPLSLSAAWPSATSVSALMFVSCTSSSSKGASQFCMDCLIFLDRRHCLHQQNLLSESAFLNQTRLSA